MSQKPYKICPDCVARFDDLEQEFCPTHNKRLLLVAPAHDSLVGTTLSERFTLTEQLGKGGFGAVYRAVQHPIEREVAVKVLHREHAESELQVKRFFNEGRLISNLRNPHTIQLYDFGQTDEGLLYMAIEFSPGKTMASALKGDAKMAPARVLHIMTQVCEALVEAHESGIVHRDLKPDNIMLEQRPHAPDYVKVLDFGIAKILDSPDTGPVTATGIINGTPTYMSPEQAQGKELTAASDLYSVGILMYRALSGKLPIQGDTPIATVMGQVQKQPDMLLNVAPDLDRELGALVMELLLKNPAKRPISAAHVRDRLRGLARASSGDAAFEPAPLPTVTLDTGKTQLTTPREPSLQPDTLRSPTPQFTGQIVVPEEDLNPPTTGSTAWLWVAGAVVAVAVAIAGYFLRGPADPAAETTVPVAATSQTNSVAIADTVQRKLPQSASDISKKIVVREGAPVVANPRRVPEASPQSVTAVTALAPSQVQLEVTSPTAKAEVWLNEKRLGITPLSMKLPRTEAQQTLEVRKKGYKVHSAKVVLDGNKVLHVVLVKHMKRPRKKPPKDDGLMGLGQ